MPLILPQIAGKVKLLKFFATFSLLANIRTLWYGGIGSDLLLSKILIDPSVVKSFPILFFKAL